MNPAGPKQLNRPKDHKVLLLRLQSRGPMTVPWEGNQVQAGIQKETRKKRKEENKEQGTIKVAGPASKGGDLRRGNTAIFNLAGARLVVASNEEISISKRVLGKLFGHTC